MNRIPALIAIAAACLAPAGCTKPPPPVVAVSGVALLNGKPLDKAQITFFPTLADLSSDYVATAVTDDQGRFTLLTAGKDGVAACEHKVVVTEGPMPKGARGEGDRAQSIATEHYASLKNRPLPKPYSVAADTPLIITISGPQVDLKIELTGQ
jgi:hypothetical protein